MPTRSKSLFTRTTAAIRKRVDSYLARRPHRSFRLTRRRDYVRSLTLPGYFAFTKQVNSTIWKYRKVFIPLVIVYAVFSGLLVGLGSQESYSNLTATLKETGTEVFKGNLGELGRAGLLFASIGASGLTGTLTEGQQIYAAILALLVWLTTVWLLRNLIAGHKVKMRDGLYSAGAPLVATLIVGILMAIQLLPIAIATLGYSAAEASGLLSGGVATMLFWVAAALLGALSLFWVTSTFFALIIVTLPGTYPIKALRISGDMVVGRRIRILLRIVWMTLVVVVVWALVLLPTILLDGWLKGIWSQIEWLPIIPVALLIMATITFVWSAAYVYLLYRKVIEDDADPA